MAMTGGTMSQTSAYIFEHRVFGTTTLGWSSLRYTYAFQSFCISVI